MRRMLGILGVLAVIAGLYFANLMLSGTSGDGGGQVVVPAVTRGQSSGEGYEPLSTTADVRQYLIDDRLVTEGDDTGGIAGVVFGDGRLVGATVRVTALSDVSAVTNEEGVFRLDQVRPGHRDLFVSAPGWAPALIEDVLVRAGELTRVEVALEKALGATIEVHGPGGDRTNAPVAGASVSLFAGGRSAWVFTGGGELANSGTYAETDASGRALFDQVRPGSYYALVRAPEFPVWRGDIVIDGESDVVRIDLLAGGEIEGRVVDSAGRPQPGAVLIGPGGRVTHPSFYYGRERGELNDLGHFRIGGVPEGEHHLLVILDNGEVAITEDALSVAANETVHVELTADATATIRGRVMDQDKAPLAGAEVRVLMNALLHPEARLFPGFERAAFASLERTELTDSDGHYVLEHVRTAAGRVKVTAEREGHADAKESPELRPGEDLVLDFILGVRDSLVSGRVTAPFPGDLSGITVIAKMDSGENEGAAFDTLTRSDGSFQVAVPSDGTVRLVPSVRRFTPACDVDPKILDGVVPGSEDVEFKLVPKHFLSLRVVDEAGLAVRAVEVSLFDDIDQRFRPSRIENDSQGRFEVTVDPERHLFATVCSVGMEPVEVWDLERYLADIVLVEMRRTGHDVPVRVVSSEGEGIPGARVALAWFGERGAFPTNSALVPSAQADADGRAVLQAVPANAPRDFIVVPGLPDAPPVFHVTASELDYSGDTIILRTPKSVAVAIEVIGPRGAPGEGTGLVVADDGTPISPRAFKAVRSDGPNDAPTSTTLVDGRLSLHLAPGRYSFHYLDPMALSGDFLVFPFVVVDEEPNVFKFSAGG